MINLIFLGPPGSGKGTQAKKLAEKIDAFYFGMGDLIRQEMDSGTEMGKKLKEIWTKEPSKLLPEELINQLAAEKIKDVLPGKEIIFDGFPRSIAQQKWFEEFLPSKNLLVINIKVNKESLIQRMSTRRICSDCGKVFFRADLTGQKECDVCGGKLIQRKDDEPEIIRKRFSVYDEETKPLIDYFFKKNILIDINGEPAIDQVTNEIWEKLDAKKNSS